MITDLVVVIRDINTYKISYPERPRSTSNDNIKIKALKIKKNAVPRIVSRNFEIVVRIEAGLCLPQFHFNSEIERK